jgi:hypothetical protein
MTFMPLRPRQRSVVDLASEAASFCLPLIQTTESAGLRAGHLVPSGGNQSMNVFPRCETALDHTIHECPAVPSEQAESSAAAQGPSGL